MIRAVAVITILAATAQTRAEPERITFHDAVARAIANNPDRLVAEEEIERVRALLQQATAALLPHVNAGAVYTRIEGDRFVTGHRAEAANSITGALTVDAPLVDLRAYADRKRARDHVTVSAAESERVKRDVAIAAARAYFAAYSAARLYEIAVHARNTSKAHVDFELERRRGGIGTELDLERAQAELATNETQVAGAVTAQIHAEEALGVIIGSDRPAAASTEPELGEPPSGSGLSRRADVIAGRITREAATESQRLDWMNWAPTLRLVGDGFVTHPVVDPLPRAGYQIVIALDFQLYDGGLRDGLHHQHLAEEVQSRELEVGIDRQASSELREARITVEVTRTARDAARRASDLSAATLDLANVGYRAGTATSLEVIDAERTALDAATRALIADDDHRQAQLDLLAAAGAFP